MPEIGESVYLKKYKCHAIILDRQFNKVFKGNVDSLLVFGNKITSYISTYNHIQSSSWASNNYELLIGDLKGWIIEPELIRAMGIIKFV